MSTSAEPSGAEPSGAEPSDSGRPVGQFVLSVRALDDPDVARMVDELQAEYLRRYGGHDEAPTAATEFAAPNGVLLVGVLDGDQVALGGWRRRPNGDAEVKRVYVADRARRRGLARTVMAELERTARESGAGRMVLSTGSRQPEAVALYRQRGYTPVTGWGVYADDPDEIFLAKRLR